MTRWVLALAVLSLAAVQDEWVENPEYKGWSAYKPGAWVKFKMSNDMGQMKVEGEVTSTLKELTAEKAVLENKVIVEMMGTKQENLQTRTLAPKIKKGTDSDGSKFEIEKEGDEELEIKGRKYKCRWVLGTLHSKSGEMKIKNWRCGDIVGGSAKMEMTGEGPMKMTTTMTAVDWKEGAK